MQHITLDGKDRMNPAPGDVVLSLLPCWHIFERYVASYHQEGCGHPPCREAHICEEARPEFEIHMLAPGRSAELFALGRGASLVYSSIRNFKNDLQVGHTPMPSACADSQVSCCRRRQTIHCMYHA